MSQEDKRARELVTPEIPNEHSTISDLYADIANRYGYDRHEAKVRSQACAMGLIKEVDDPGWRGRLDGNLDFYMSLAEALKVERAQAKRLWLEFLYSKGRSGLTAFQQVAEFHAKFELPGLEQEAPRELTDEEALFRIAFMLEELREYIECSGFTALHVFLEQLLVDMRKHITGEISLDLVERTDHRDMHGELDALIDLSYVLHGTALFHGFSKFDQAFTHVHTAGNMVKVRATSIEQSKRGTKLDVVKPPGWTAPVLTEYLS